MRHVMFKIAEKTHRNSSPGSNPGSDPGFILSLCHSEARLKTIIVIQYNLCEEFQS